MTLPQWHLEACSVGWADCPGATLSCPPGIDQGAKELLLQPPLGKADLAANDVRRGCAEDTLPHGAL